jgi:hypothetical protein
MRKYTYLLFAAVLLMACGKEKNEKAETPDTSIAFKTEKHTKKTSLPCSDPCANVSIEIPVAQGSSVASDSINKTVFNTIRKIIFFGEKPYTATTYDALNDSFIGSYEELKKEFPEDMIGWEGKVKGSIDYQSDKVLNIKLNHYTFTGGAHGYEGNTSLLFNPETGKILKYSDIFNDEAAFKAFAEKKFRAKFKIPEGKNINATGLMFENDTFGLPLNIFFRENGLLLYYNTYEVASHVEQQKELLLPYSEIEQFLKVK